MSRPGVIVAALAVAVAATQVAVANVPARAGTYPGDNGRIAYVSGGDVFSMNPDGTDITDLTQHSAFRADHLSVSPNGTRIAFTVDALSDHDAAGLYVMNADGSNLTNVLGAQSANFVAVTGPSWARAGDRIAFSGFDLADHSELWVVDANGNHLRQITTCDCVDFPPAWSPIDDTIAWADVHDIDFVNPDAGTATTIAVGDQLDGNHRLSWSPDGQYLAFDNYTFYNGIWRIKSDGSDLTQIIASTGDYAVSDPVFSPDGTQIAVELFTDKSRIYLIDAATFALSTQPVAATLGDMFYPDWGPQPPTPTSVTLAVDPADPVELGTVTTLTATVSPAVAGTVQFLRNGTAVTGAVTVNGGTATAQVSLLAGTAMLTAQFSPAAADYAGSTSTASSYLVLATPHITGTAKVGHTVTCSGTPGGSQSFTWYRNGITVAGATSGTLTLTAAYYRAAVSCRQAVTKNATTVDQTSAPVTVAIGDALRNTSRPSFSGTAVVGRTQTARPGAWSPKATSYRYQWLRDGHAIRGATNATYRLVRADRNHRISVRVTAKRYGYKSGVARSAAKLIRR